MENVTFISLHALIVLMLRFQPSGYPVFEPVTHQCLTADSTA